MSLILNIVFAILFVKIHIFFKSQHKFLLNKVKIPQIYISNTLNKHVSFKIAIVSMLIFAKQFFHLGVSEIFVSTLFL